MYLLDTHVVSELRKVRAGRADKGVATWADSVTTGELFVSAITIQELQTGILRIERRDDAQGAVLQRWFDRHVLPAFEGRILPIDTRVAMRSAALHVPDPKPALVHGMTVVTRNVEDFAGFCVTLTNPWAA
jgi:predicted nucleic acid-binding protein